MNEPTTQAGMRVLNYHRSYKTQCGVHEDEMAPIVAEAEIEAATLARARADKAEAALWLRDEAIVVLHEQAHKAEAALAECQEAIRDFLVVRWRYVHQTGGKPTTDEDMDAATKGLLDALPDHKKATEVTLMEASIVQTDAAPGEMDEHGAWAFKKAVAYTNVTDEDWVMADD